MKLAQSLKEKIIEKTNITEAELVKILNSYQPSISLPNYDGAIHVIRLLQGTQKPTIGLISDAIELYVAMDSHCRTEEKTLDRLVHCHDKILNKNSRRRSTYYDMTIDVLLIGDAGVGKHNLISRYAKNIYGQWPRQVFEAFFEHKYCRIDGSEIRLNFCHHRSMIRNQSNYKPSQFNVMIFCYDVTDHTSFSSIDEWEYQTKSYEAPYTLKILVGLKNDDPDKKVVDPKEAKAFSDKNNMTFFEASAKDDAYIDEMFEYAIQHQLARAIKNEGGWVSFQATPKEETVTPIPAQPIIQDTQPINMWTSSTILATGGLVIGIASAIFFDIGGFRTMCTKAIEKLYGTSYQDITHTK